MIAEMSELELDKKIRKVFMASESVFSLAAITYGWMAPLGTLFGVINDLTIDKPDSLRQEMDEAALEALEMICKTTSSDSYKRIAEELKVVVPNPDSIEEFIEQTQTFQTEYNTNNDKLAIIKMFDANFAVTASKKEHLSHFYLLTTGVITGNQVYKIYSLLQDDDKKLDHIQADVSEIKGVGHRIKEFITISMNGLINVLVSMAVFLLVSFAIFPYRSKDMVSVAFWSYAISETLMFFWREERYMQMMKRGKMVGLLESTNMYFRKWDKVLHYILPVILTISSFWLIYGTGDRMDIETTVALSGVLALGAIISILLKTTKPHSG